MTREAREVAHVLGLCRGPGTYMRENDDGSIEFYEAEHMPTCDTLTAAIEADRSASQELLREAAKMLGRWRGAKFDVPAVLSTLRHQTFELLERLAKLDNQRSDHDRR